MQYKRDTQHPNTVLRPNKTWGGFNRWIPVDFKGSGKTRSSHTEHQESGDPAVQVKTSEVKKIDFKGKTKVNVRTFRVCGTKINEICSRSE